MATVPYFEDIFDATDQFEWGDLRPLRPLMPVDEAIDELNPEYSHRTPFGQIINAQQEQRVLAWRISFVGLDEDDSERFYLKRFHGKGVFDFFYTMDTSKRVKWISQTFDERVEKGGTFALDFELMEVIN